MTFTWHNYINREWGGIHLSPKQDDLLFVLFVNATRPQTMDDILDHLYPDPDEMPLTADWCVRRYVSDINKRCGKVIRRDWNGRYMLEVAK